MVYNMPLKNVSGHSYKATIRTLRSSLVFLYLFLQPAAEQHEAKRLEEEFMSSAKLGQVEKVN